MAVLVQVSISRMQAQEPPKIEEAANNNNNNNAENAEADADNAAENDNKRAGDANEDKVEDDFELTPPPFIPNMAELSEFGRSFYKAGGVHADAEDEVLRREQEERDAAAEKQALEDKRRRAELHRAQRRLSASGALLLEETAESSDQKSSEKQSSEKKSSKKSKKSRKSRSRSNSGSGSGSRSHSRSRSRSPSATSAKSDALLASDSLLVPQSPAPAIVVEPASFAAARDSSIAGEVHLAVPAASKERAESAADSDDFGEIPELAATSNPASETSSYVSPPRSPLVDG